MFIITLFTLFTLLNLLTNLIKQLNFLNLLLLHTHTHTYTCIYITARSHPATSAHNSGLKHLCDPSPVCSERGLLHFWQIVLGAVLEKPGGGRKRPRSRAGDRSRSTSAFESRFWNSIMIKCTGSKRHLRSAHMVSTLKNCKPTPKP